MTDEHKKLAIEVYTRQHELYAEKTALALEFPIKLILTLNASAVAASLLLVREVIGNDTAVVVLESVHQSFWMFGAGVICVLVASWFQWQLYSKIMLRKRGLLNIAIDSNDYKGVIEPFVNEPKENERTSFHGWCFFFVLLSFYFFLTGVYLLGEGLEVVVEAVEKQSDCGVQQGAPADQKTVTQFLVR